MKKIGEEETEEKIEEVDDHPITVPVLPVVLSTGKKITVTVNGESGDW
jgi:hypothetical protein